MPIDKVSNIRRYPRLGRIRTGEKAVGQRGPYPKALDHFIIIIIAAGLRFCRFLDKKVFTNTLYSDITKKRSAGHFSSFTIVFFHNFHESAVFR